MCQLVHQGLNAPEACFTPPSFPLCNGEGQVQVLSKFGGIYSLLVHLLILSLKDISEGILRVLSYS